MRSNESKRFDDCLIVQRAKRAAGSILVDGSVIKDDPVCLAMFRKAMKHQGQRTDLGNNVPEVERLHRGNSKAFSIDRVTRARLGGGWNYCYPLVMHPACELVAGFPSWKHSDIDSISFAGVALFVYSWLMLGPPGSGKTMLAKRLPTILPKLTAEESIETTRIYSSLGQMKQGQPLMATRPFRAPHHTISNAGLVGGGNPPAPGEISLAHNGVLFLDELPEFDRRTLEVMRQPLEDRIVTISRALRSTTFPANFMLVAALNPCPCGFRGDPRRTCTCNSTQIERYMSRISGPLLDRIDIHIEVPAVPFEELSSKQDGTSSATIRQSVELARATQKIRFGNSSLYNAQMSSRQLREFCPLERSCRAMLQNCCNDLGLSARAHDKILRVSRTIADLDDSPEIQETHLQEAINYRMLDRNLFA